MNIYCSSDGTIIHVDPERVFQGSVGANVVRFIGAFPHSAQVLMAYKLPNGAYTSPKMLTPVAELAEVQTPDGGKFSVWEGRIGATPKLDSNGNVMYDEKGTAVYDLDYTITENYGTAYMQFHVYDAVRSGTVNGVELAFGNAILATAMVEFEIEKGVPVIPPVVETEDAQALLTLILGVVSNTQTAYNSLEDDVERNTANVTAHGTAIQDLQDGKLDKTGGDVTGEVVVKSQGSPSKTEISDQGVFVSNNSNGAGTAYADGRILSLGKQYTFPQKEGALVSAQEAVGSVYFGIDEDNNLNLRLYDAAGVFLANYSISLPVDNVVVSGYYDEETSTIALTLKSGNVVKVPVGALVSGLISSSEKGQPNGVASLDADGKVPKEQLPEGIGGGGSGGGSGGSGGESVDLSEYLKTVDLANAMVSEFNTPTRTLTDEEKTSACDWIGAAKVAQNINSIPSYSDTIYARQANGTIIMAIVDASDGLALLSSGRLIVSGASEAQIAKRDGKPLTCNRLDHAVIEALSNYKGTPLTEEQKSKIRALLGI